VKPEGLVGSVAGRRWTGRQAGREWSGMAGDG